MTPEQQRIAIAETCGFINVRMWSESCIASVGMNAEGKYWGSLSVPDYLNDLNAMHEAEKVIGPIKGIEFCYHLNEMGMSGEWEILTATAAQRAEAFLRTIGKWTTNQNEL